MIARIVGVAIVVTLLVSCSSAPVPPVILTPALDSPSCLGITAADWATILGADEVAMGAVPGVQYPTSVGVGACQVRVSGPEGDFGLGVAASISAPGTDAVAPAGEARRGWCVVRDVGRDARRLLAGGLEIFLSATEGVEAPAASIQQVDAAVEGWINHLGCAQAKLRPSDQGNTRVSTQGWRRTDLPVRAGLVGVAIFRKSGSWRAELAATDGHTAQAWAAGVLPAASVESAGEKVLIVVDDAYLRDLAAAVGGELGGRTGIAPRLFLKKLVSDVLDRVDLFEDFNPRRDYHLTVSADELTPAEREAHVRGSHAAAGSVDDIELDM